MSDNEKFKIFCGELNDECKRLQNSDRENISDDDAFRAYLYIKLMKIELEGDFLLFLACINLLNSYVKQDGAKIGYSFKREIDYFLEICLRKNNRMLKICEENDGSKGNLLIIQLYSIQFSFHSIKYRYSETELDKDMEWDGIRKQKCALTIYKRCIDNKILRSNITFRGEDLLCQIEQYMDSYRKGCIDFNSRI